jgi:hypothetical protein
LKKVIAVHIIYMKKMRPNLGGTKYISFIIYMMHALLFYNHARCICRTNGFHLYMHTQIVYQLLVQGISTLINWNGEYSYIQRFFSRVRVSIYCSLKYIS